MSVEDGAKLYDLCPHVSDSVSTSLALDALLLHDRLFLQISGPSRKKEVWFLLTRMR